jgi:hypothetical protein
MNRAIQLSPTTMFRARDTRGFVFCLCVLCLLCGSALAQTQLPEPPLPIDPRPIGELLSRSEKASLAEAQPHGPKKTIELYLRFSDAHLQAAFDAIRVNNYVVSERELDIYNKAVAEAGREAFELKDGVRPLAKKIEQTLYRQIKVLESIDRLFPTEREGFAEAALRHSKQVRVQALNKGLGSGNVLKDGDDKPEEESPSSKEPMPKKDLSLPQSINFRLLGFSRDRTSTEHDDVIRGFDASTMNRARSSQIAADYLTEEEDDHVREAQAAEARVKVFMKIADRRLRAITGEGVSADKKDQKKADAEDREWGALPKLTRAELLRHYRRAIAECMDKLEDAYERNPKSASLPKALATLRDGTDRQLQSLRSLASATKGEDEAAALRDAIEQAETANKGARDGLTRNAKAASPLT